MARIDVINGRDTSNIGSGFKSALVAAETPLQDDLQAITDAIQAAIDADDQILMSEVHVNKIIGDAMVSIVGVPDGSDEQTAIDYKTVFDALKAEYAAWAQIGIDAGVEIEESTRPIPEVKLPSFFTQEPE